MSGGQDGDDGRTEGLDSVRALIEAIQGRRDSIEASAGADNAEVMRKLIVDVEAQLEAPEPDRFLVKQALETLTRLLAEGADSGLADRARQAAIRLP